MARPCPTCGEPMPDEDVLCSLSHTILPGKPICTECGYKETTDAAWAEGRRIGYLQANVCKETDAMLAERDKENPDDQTTVATGDDAAAAD